MVKIHIKVVIALLISLCLWACNEEDLKSGTEVVEKEGAYKLSGFVEKGPFVKGAYITLQPMDSDLKIVGDPICGQVLDNRGYYNLGSFDIITPFVLITVDGYQYCEVLGDYTEEQITLNAIADISDKSTLNVNIVSHFKCERIKKLMAIGMTFAEADSQAQSEFVSQFGLQRFADVDFSQVSIADGSEEAMALLAMSVDVQKSDPKNFSGEQMAYVINHFAKKGCFEEKKNDPDKNLYKIISNIERSLVSHYKKLGYDISVGNLIRYIDWDKDGVAGNEYSSDDNFIIAQTVVEMGKSGGYAEIEIHSDYELGTKPFGIGDTSSVSDEYINEYSFFNPAPELKVHSYIKNGKLIINAVANKCNIPRTCYINIYNYFGDVLETVAVNFEANPQYPMSLSNVGKEMMGEMLSNFSKAMNGGADGDFAYCGVVDRLDFKTPLSPLNSALYNIWKDYFTAVNSVLNIKYCLSGIYGCQELADAIEVYNAILYSAMMKEWGDLPLNKDAGLGNINNPRTACSDICDYFIELLNGILESTVEGKTPGVTYREDDYFILSKDLVSIALADMYMQKKDYDKALEYYKKGIAEYTYSDVTEFKDNNKEILLGLHLGKISNFNNAVVPVYVYSDIKLRIAECMHYLGDSKSSKTIINEVYSHHSNLQVSNAPELTRIDKIRRFCLYPGYLGFIARSGLGSLTYELEDYQLLWPIPQKEIILNPSLTQNDGY